MEDFLLHGHEYEYDINWIVCTLKRHGIELSQIDQKIKDAVKLELSDERITALVIDIISNASGVVNVKIPPEELTPATGDGSANDTAAIQGCIDYVHQKGEGAVFFPSGKYLTNSLTLYDNVALVGESRYTTSLVAAMGSRNVVIGENASMVSIANMTLDGNQPYQVNDIDGVALTGKDWLFTNLIVKDVFRAFVLTLEGEHCQMDNVVIEGVGDSAITILGGKEVQMHQVHVSGISSTIGQYGIEVSSDHAWMTDMVIDSQIPIGLILNGDMCYFDGYIYGVTVPYRDGGNSNSITVRGVSNQQTFSGDTSISVGGEATMNYTTATEHASTFNQTSEAYHMQPKNFIIRPENDFNYRSPETFSTYFDSIGARDYNNNPYRILTANQKTQFMNQELLNLKEFGARGDNVTDDSDSIQTWVTEIYRTGRKGFIPAGHYKLSKEIILQPGICIVGTGDESDIVCSNVGKLIVNGGNRSSGTILRDFQMSALGTVSGPAVVLNGYWNLIDNVTFIAFGARTYNYDNNWGVCIRMVKTWYSIIQNCTFLNAPLHTSTIFNFNGTAIDITDQAVNNIITGNMFNNFSRVISAGDATEGNKIINNIFLNNTYGIVDTGYMNNIESNLIDMCVKRGCVLKGSGTIVANNFFAGHYYEPYTSDDTLRIIDSQAEAASITGNYIQGNSVYAAYGIISTSATHVRIENNYINKFKTGIHLSGNNSIISGNVTRNIQNTDIYLNGNFNELIGNVLSKETMTISGLNNQTQWDMLFYYNMFQLSGEEYVTRTIPIKYSETPASVLFSTDTPGLDIIYNREASTGGVVSFSIYPMKDSVLPTKNVLISAVYIRN